MAFENQTKAAVLCGRNTVQIRPGSLRDLSLEHLAQNLKELADEIVLNPYLLACNFGEHRIVLFKDGRALIHGTSEVNQAKAIYNRIVG